VSRRDATEKLAPIFIGPFPVGFGFVRPVEIAPYIAFVKGVVKAAGSSALGAVVPISQSNIKTAAGDVSVNQGYADDVTFLDGLSDLSI
jgi:hypothetical protein